MNSDVLFIFLILLFGLLVCSFLGNMYPKEGMKLNNNRNQDDNSDDSDSDDDDSDTSIKGNIKSGIGDCMPCGGVGCPEKEYSLFNGDAYFIDADEWAQFISEDQSFEELLESNVLTSVVDGDYETDLTPGEYIVGITGLPVGNHNNIMELTISSGEELEKDFQFFECTSY